MTDKEKAAERLAFSRRSHRGQLTKLTKRADEFIENFDELSDDELDKLESTMDSIRSKINFLKQLDEELLELIPTKELEEAVITFDDYLLDVQENYDVLQMRLKRSRGRCTRKTTSDPTTKDKSNCRLPKLDLETFSGDILLWQTFIDGFIASVHNNSKLEDIEKFQYLKRQLKGEAARTIHGLALTNLNYAHAMEILRKRYGQRHKIVAATMKALMELPVTTSADAKGLRHFYDTLESHVRTLDTLEKDQSSYGDFLVSIVLDKLPTSTKQQLARDHGSCEWSLPDLRVALGAEIEALEAGDVSADSSSACSGYSSELQSTAAFHTNVKSQRKPYCAFCKGTHYSGECTVYAKPADRLTQTRKLQLCFNCLGRHKIKDCKSKFTCRKCKKRHHTAICSGSRPDEKETNSNNQNTTQQSERETTESEETVQSVTTGCTDEMTVTHVGKSGSVLLKTAVTDVSSSTASCKATILFDEGSTRSFITTELAEKLSATSNGSHTLSLTTFGGKPGSARKFDEVTFSVHTISGEKMQMSALVVPRISQMNNRINSSLLSLPHLQGLTLAHPISNVDSLQITLLIGADFFWDFVEDHVIRGPGPTAVRSKLGYLLSGHLHSQTKDSQALSHVISTDTSQDVSDYQQYWDLETIGIKDDPCRAMADDTDRYKSFCKTHLRHDGTRYVASLPWKENHNPLPTNYDVCVKRTRNTIQRLSSELRRTYDSIIQDQVARGFIEEVIGDDLTSGHYYHTTRL
ncbi:uncharacterized protein LOC135497698 [Lineus longissimus]|uniref:uncharacterized protein LOC135497698 n=1 Tax=Lineus longissimus TaxID=88925 RepID=UPI00315D1AD3